MNEKRFLAGKYQEAIAFVGSELTAFEAAEKSIARANFAFEQPPDLTPSPLEARVRALPYRGHLGEATRTAECWRDRAEKRDKDRDEQRDNAARVLALREAERVAHLPHDADCAGVRDPTAFAGIAGKLRQKGTATRASCFPTCRRRPASASVTIHPPTRPRWRRGRHSARG